MIQLSLPLDVMPATAGVPASFPADDDEAVPFPGHDQEADADIFTDGEDEEDELPEGWVYLASWFARLLASELTAIIARNGGDGDRGKVLASHADALRAFAETWDAGRPSDTLAPAQAAVRYVADNLSSLRRERQAVIASELAERLKALGGNFFVVPDELSAAAWKMRLLTAGEHLAVYGSAIGSCGRAYVPIRRASNALTWVADVLANLYM